MNCLKTYLLSAIDLQCYPSTDIPDSSSSNSNSSSSLYHESTFPKSVTWTPRLLPLEKGRRIATTIINGLADGLVIGTVIRKQSE
ncbi:hypothetical protein JKF63_00938 [Porcisia hertigi]|uniref:Uncharacterized protein n=1 Tax=Porcisia hertigi TaxID=2761500 RepID=A0A836HCK8_9TRYP|nr:hypothetical protein JKF63_00938 [Porcisia hertigi]